MIYPVTLQTTVQDICSILGFESLYLQIGGFKIRQALVYFYKIFVKKFILFFVLHIIAYLQNSSLVLSVLQYFILKITDYDVKRKCYSTYYFFDHFLFAYSNLTAGECPLQLQNEILSNIGYETQAERMAIGAATHLLHLFCFFIG